MEKQLLLDGNCLAARAAFALPETIVGPSGRPVNIVLGFTSMLLRLLCNRTPASLAVAFDSIEPSFRFQLRPAYKAGRVKLPSSFQDQLSIIKEILTVLSLTHFSAPLFEADDLIATWASRARAQNKSALIVTTDRDLVQLVADPYIALLIPHRAASGQDSLYAENDVFARFGVSSAQYVELAALRGDPSDNIPGVPGVGMKTAARLLQRFGSITEILKHADELTPLLRERLMCSQATIKSNIDLMTLVRVVPVPEVALVEPSSWTAQRTADHFLQLGLDKLLPRFERLVAQYATLPAYSR